MKKNVHPELAEEGQRSGLGGKKFGVGREVIYLSFQLNFHMNKNATVTKTE